MDEQKSRPRWLVLGKVLFQLLVLVLVAWGIWRTVEKAVGDLREQQTDVRRELAALEAELRMRQEADPADQRLLDQLRLRQRYLRSQQFSLWQIHSGWLMLSALLYLLSMIPSWVFWHRALRALGQHPGPWQTLRAFCIGHLGKYVPGKAMVVVLRTGLVRGSRVNTAVAAASVFIETLTLMSVGGMMAAAILAVLLRHQWQLLLWGLLIMVVSGVPTLPPVFRRLVMLLKIRGASSQAARALEGLNYRLIGLGWCLMPLAWLLMGLSLWAVMQALPGQTATAHILRDVMLMTATAALAVVLGFLSLIPGGFGVREAVVMTLLADVWGGVMAIAAAVLLRLVWLVSELIVSIILYFGARPRSAEIPGPA